MQTQAVTAIPIPIGDAAMATGMGMGVVAVVAVLVGWVKRRTLQKGLFVVEVGVGAAGVALAAEGLGLKPGRKLRLAI